MLHITVLSAYANLPTWNARGLRAGWSGVSSSLAHALILHFLLQQPGLRICRAMQCVRSIGTALPALCNPKARPWKAKSSLSESVSAWNQEAHVALLKGQSRSCQNSPDSEIQEYTPSVNNRKVLRRMHKTCISLVSGRSDPRTNSSGALEVVRVKELKKPRPATARAWSARGVTLTFPWYRWMWSKRL